MSRTPPGPVVCVTGPTASGKSAVAELVAERLSSSVVSTDAMQVYRGMDVGTAKVPVGDRRVPLLMVDVADPGSPYSVALFQRQARECVDGLLAQGRVPVLCGGTGLYLDAVIDEMDFPSGEVGGEARERYDAYANAHGDQALWDLLNKRDPESATLVHPHNRRRVVRALELADQGASYAKRTARLSERRPHYDASVWALTMDRQRLYGRIDARVDAMFEGGLVDEVKGLMEMGLGEAVTSMQAIGYKEVVDALEGRISMEVASESIKRSTRRYAKRQLSWIRRDGRARWIDLDEVGPQEAASLIVSTVVDGAGPSGRDAS